MKIKKNNKKYKISVREKNIVGIKTWSINVNWPKDFELKIGRTGASAAKKEK